MGATFAQKKKLIAGPDRFGTAISSSLIRLNGFDVR